MFPKGARVRVTSGPYRGMEGVVQNVWTIGSFLVRLDGGPNEDVVIDKWLMEPIKNELERDPNWWW